MSKGLVVKNDVVRAAMKQIPEGTPTEIIQWCEDNGGFKVSGSSVAQVQAKAIAEAIWACGSKDPEDIQLQLAEDGTSIGVAQIKTRIPAVRKYMAKRKNKGLGSPKLASRTAPQRSQMATQQSQPAPKRTPVVGDSWRPLDALHAARIVVEGCGSVPEAVEFLEAVHCDMHTNISD